MQKHQYVSLGNPSACIHLLGAASRCGNQMINKTRARRYAVIAAATINNDDFMAIASPLL
jgi:hypothetical protein